MESEAHAGWLYGREVLVVGAPAELVFDVAPGSWRLRGFYGCEPAPPSLPSIGIDFRILLAKGTPLLQRSLDPRRVPGDRGMQKLELAFETDTRTKLVLQTLLRAPKVPPDAAYWCELTLEPASASDRAGD